MPDYSKVYWRNREITWTSQSGEIAARFVADVPLACAAVIPSESIFAAEDRVRRIIVLKLEAKAPKLTAHGIRSAIKTPKAAMLPGSGQSF